VSYDKWLFHERFISGVFYGFITPQPVGNEQKKETNIVYKTVLLNHVS